METIYEVRFSDQSGNEITDLKTNDENEAIVRRNILRSMGYKLPHIQYTFGKGGKIGMKPDFIKNDVLLGKEIELKLPNGEKRKAQFAIVELDNIIASHNENTFANSEGYPLDENGENINDRNYKDDLSAQSKVIEYAQNLESDRLITTSRTPSGTPIITTDGIVVSGNNRTMSLKLTLKDFPEKYNEYRDFLNEEISAFGFKEEIDNFKNPVLVRIDYDFPDYNTMELSKYNKTTGKAERPIDKAIKLGKILSTSSNCRAVIEDIVGQYETFSEFYANRGDQKKLRNTLIDCNVLTSQELPAFFTETGMTEQGKELVENLLAGMVLSKEALIVSTDGAAKKYKQILITSLPVLTKNLSFGEDSIIDYLNEAIVMQNNMGSLLFKDYIAQINIFGERPSKKAMVLNRLLASGRNNFKRSIEKYNDFVIDNMNESLFGDKPSTEEIFQTLIEKNIDQDELKIINLATKEELPNIQAPTPIMETKTQIKKITNNFINGNFFKEKPENILGEQVSGMSRWKKPITEIKGSIEDLNKIDVPLNFLTANQYLEPLITVINQPVSMATDKDTEIIDNIKIANIQSGIDQSKKSAKKRNQKDQSVIHAINEGRTDTYTLQEAYDVLNPEISIEELRVFLWHKNNTGRPITNPEWVQLSKPNEDSRTEQEKINQWIKDGLIYYFNGELLPAFLYLSGNIYDRKMRLSMVSSSEESESESSGNDKDYIISNFGQNVYDNQATALMDVFSKKYEKRLIIKGEGSDDGLVILPISKFAKKFKINNLVDGNEFKWKKITAASNKYYGRPDFLAIGLQDRDKIIFDELSLTDAFCLWLRTDETIQFKKGVTYADIIKVYIQGKSKPATEAKPDWDGKFTGEQLVIKKKEDAAWERIRAKTREEGDRLFVIFLDTQLTLNDKVKLETQWNRDFNGVIPIDFNKVPVAFRSNKNEIVKWEKREAVAFTFIQGSGLLAYDVGVGKTPSAIFTICQFIDTGYAKRPFIIVPNQTYKQWIAEFKTFAPHIKINEFYNLSNDYITEFQDINGNIVPVEEESVTIMTYEAMKQIGFNEDTLQKLGTNVRDILMQKTDESDTEKKKDRQAEALNSKVEELIGRALAKTIVNIEDFKFDFIAMDEAHAAKKVFTYVKGEKEENLGNSEKETKPKVRYDIKSGIPSYTGVKAFMLTQYIQLNNGGNTLLLTATPFTNSPLEVYSMLAMVGFAGLKEMGLNNLSTFFDNYIAISYELIINSRLKPERRQVIMGFNNLVSLQALIRRFINYKTGEQVKVPRPNKIVLPLKNKLIDGLLISLPKDEQVDTILPLTPIQQMLMDKIKSYADGEISETILCQSTGNDEEVNEDTPRADGVELDEDSLDANEKIGVRLLKAMNHARNLALSPYIFDCSGLGTPDYKSYIETSNKLLYVINCIKSIKEYHKNEGSAMSGVVIYMDRGVQYFPLIREYLIKEIGFGSHEVGIISSKLITPIDKGVSKEDAKEFVKNRFLGKFYNNLNLEMEVLPEEQRMKVLIGSSTIKEGINLQSHSSVLFNCWMDWNPTDIQQLEGRIYRQGNKFKTVRIVSPLMIDSMDIFMFQKLEEKTSRINTIWESDGRTNVLKTEEFNPKELKFSLIRDPKVLASLDIIESNELLEEKIADLNNQIKRNSKIKSYVFNVKNYSKHLNEAIEKYRPSEGRERSLDAKIKLISDVLKTQTDQYGKKMEHKSFKKPNLIKESFYSDLSPYYKPFWFDELNYSNRNLEREKRDYLEPRGITIDSIDDYTIKLKADIQDISKEKELLNAEEALKIRVQEIIEKREALGIEEKTVPEMVEQFKKLNYLLSEVKVEGIKKNIQYSCPPLDENGEARIDKDAIEILEHCSANAPDTKRANTIEVDGVLEYTPERKLLHQRIIHDLVKDSICITNDEPICVLTGGAPGSGKSSFLKKYAPYLDSDKIFHIDADLVREKLPEYKGWNSASTHMETKDIVDELLNGFDKPCKHDLLYDGTMNNGKKYIPLIRKIKSLGYKTFIIFMDIPKEVSLERALGRFKRGGENGRYVPMEVIDDFYKNYKSGLNEIKNAVDGYIVVDSLTYEIIERGGISIPTNRSYYKMYNEIEGTPIAEEEIFVDTEAIKLKMRELFTILHPKKMARGGLMKFANDCGCNHTGNKKMAEGGNLGCGCENKMMCKGGKAGCDCEKKGTNEGRKGGTLVGDKHSAPSGGIRAVVVSDYGNKPVLLESEEVIINAQAAKNNCELLSKINQSAGNGVALKC